MKTNLLVCPRCQKAGLRQVLGEVDDSGNLIVMRFHKGTTKVIGAAYAVTCGECGELVYLKHDKNQLSKLLNNGTTETSNQRLSWIHWESVAFEFGTTGPAGTFLR